MKRKEHLDGNEGNVKRLAGPLTSNQYMVSSYENIASSVLTQVSDYNSQFPQTVVLTAAAPQNNFHNLSAVSPHQSEHQGKQTLIQAFPNPLVHASDLPQSDTITAATQIPSPAVLSHSSQLISGSSVVCTTTSLANSYDANVYTVTPSDNKQIVASASYENFPVNGAADCSEIGNSTLPSVVSKKEPLTERQQRLSVKFDALIRAKTLELVKARGCKKTCCPSEVARALSPKSWRDLMPAVRKIGAQLVKEGLIVVTQKGIIVDLSTVKGPIRFGLVEQNG